MSLSEEVLRKRQDELDKANRETLTAMVRPVREDLQKMQQSMVDARMSSASQHATLDKTIESLSLFAHDMAQKTADLTRALQAGGKMQGDWGEQLLASILEGSGLRPGEEFETQASVKDNEGNSLRPDVIVHCPGGRNIIIDSKVSLTAYTDYCGAANDDERKAADRANYDSLWRHVTELSAKKYPTLVGGSAPVTLMFVPNEGSYILAMNRDPQLGIKAYNKGVLIVNPTNLMVVLRLMFLTWQSTRQEKNSRAILDAASKIYEKYATVCDTLVTLGNQLTTARTTYDKAIGQMREGRGNLSKQVQDLLKLGATATKQIPENLEGLE